MNPAQYRPLKVRLISSWSFLRGILALATIFGAIRLGQAQITGSTFIQYDFPFNSLPLWTRIFVIGSLLQAIVFLACALGIWVDRRWSAYTFLFASSFTFFWDLSGVVFLNRSFVLPLYSFVAVCITWWFYRQPDIKAYFSWAGQLPGLPSVRIGKMPAELAMACLAGVLIITVEIHNLLASQSRVVPASGNLTATISAESNPQVESTAQPTRPSSINNPLLGKLAGRIVYSSYVYGNSDIFVSNIGDGGYIRLTDGPSDDTSPAVSPDGKRIAFVSKSGNTTEMHIIDSDGANRTRLYISTSSDGELSWSPKGQQIVFKSDRDGNTKIYVINTDGSGLTRLTANSGNDFNPAWSPDGRKIVFASDRDGNNEIYIMNADASNLRRLTENSADDHGPIWSPDGEWIAFTSTRDGNRNIYLMDTEGKNLKRLTEGPTDNGDASWSPDGRQISFSSKENNKWHISIINLDDGGQINLTVGSGAIWSLDSQYVAFLSDHEGLTPDLYMIGVDGSKLTRFSTGWFIDDLVSWLQ